ncbi:3-hydroxypropionyl-CoA dehydratase [Paraburkholderia phytofirmans OLGA172]|uniref:3-hydroxypropionyl-CoA dehydratase n=1 Tax=Paraburkholderia phytofirmans OLGA172 TaxID=1417228 RepID=A0A167VVX7_9BURK|nr:enoyl-CoA hydratase/isomerase family protein [Paraburkholderia phytofirmans]ANB72107.1 3-hydroxypropionyl-CoA dehydratase [Paraburkholderia phytofirmans OLGA172]
MNASPKIRVDRHGRHAVITLANPPMNVVSAPLTRELYAALRDLERDNEVRALVLTGAGDRAFCAGSDITEIKDLLTPGAVLEKKLIFQNKVFELLRCFPKPTIAALNGYTYGGGLEIAACCDMIVAEDHVRLCLPEIKLGLFPSSGGTFRIARKIGEARAKRMILLGEPIDARTALDWGLVTEVVERGTALTSAEALAASLAKQPESAMRAAKLLINACFDTSEAALVGQSLTASDQIFCSSDANEGVTAFLEKRTPTFR